MRLLEAWNWPTGLVRHVGPVGQKDATNKDPVGEVFFYLQQPGVQVAVAMTATVLPGLGISPEKKGEGYLCNLKSSWGARPTSPQRRSSPESLVA